MGRLLQRWSGKFVPYSRARAAGATNAVCLPNRANQQAELKVLPKKSPARGRTLSFVIPIAQSGTGGMRVLLALLAVKKVGTPPMVPTIVFGQTLLWLPKATPPVP